MVTRSFICVLVCLLLLRGITKAQDDRDQVVMGYITDAETYQPVVDAKVDLFYYGEFLKMCTTDSIGFFSCRIQETGNIELRISHIAYDTLRLVDQVVTGGKALLVQVRLDPRAEALREVIVRGGIYPADLQTQMLILRTKDVEKLAGNFYDPARLAQTQTGISIVNDQANQLSIYGMAPHFTKWRLNGHEIVNPNHLSNAGTLSDKPTPTGGGVNILSHQMLDYSIMRLPPFSEPYDNALAGIMDMKTRIGDTRSTEWRAKASLLGLEFAGEGPVPASPNSSFLFNARYSTVGLLDNLGVAFGDESINFADAAFHLHLPSNDLRTRVNVFGVGGFSTNRFSRPDDPADYTEEKDLSNINYDEDNGILGVNIEQLLGSRSVLLSGVAFSRVHRFREETRLDDANVEFLFQSDRSVESKLSAFVRLQSQLSNAITLGSGLDFLQHSLEIHSRLPGPTSTRVFIADRDMFFLKPWVTATIDISKTFSIDAGTSVYISEHNDNLLLNGSFSATWRISNVASLSGRVSRTGQTVDQSLIRFRISQIDIHNRNLDRMNADQASIQLGLRFETVKSLTNIFYGRYDNIPTLSLSPGHISNTVFNTYDSPLIDPLSPASSGRNYGISQLLHLTLNNHWYTLLSTAFYKSEYTPLDGEDWLPAQYNNRFAAHISLGKEYEVQKSDKRQTIGWNTTSHFQGGMRVAPIAVDASAGSPFTIYNYTNGYTGTLDPYIRIDLQVYLENHHENYNTRLSLDIQNVANIRNEAYHYYDHFLERVVLKKQLGIVPILSYQIDF